MIPPFQYPAEPQVRRHGPRGYSDVAGYRPWLRDEFCFRCVFCLDRETWRTDPLEVDHFEPVSLVPALTLEYENLLYACRTCNGMKAHKSVPNPCRELLNGAVTVETNGALTAHTADAERIIEQLALNAERRREYRRMWMRIIEVVRTSDPNLYQTLMSYPTSLPDLASLRPPGGNKKPEGIEQSHHARRSRSELPDVFG